MSLKIGTAVAEKGKLVKGTLDIGYFPDGTPVSLPIMIASGETEGETMWIEGAIHGNEPGGTLAIVEYVTSLDLSKLKGTIVAVPVVNLQSFRAGVRNTPVDGVNINRIFPGSPEGTFTYQLASAYIDTVCAHADYLLDFHSGGLHDWCPYYVGFADDGSVKNDIRMDMCKDCGTAFIWHGITSGGGLGGIIPSQVTARGIPAITVECGGGPVTEEDLSCFKRAIEGNLKGRGFLEGKPERRDHYTMAGGGLFPVTHVGGFFKTDLKAGIVLHKGDLIGKIINLYGEVLEEIHCPEDDMLVATLIFNNTPVGSGEGFAELIHVYEL